MKGRKDDVDDLTLARPIHRFFQNGRREAVDDEIIRESRLRIRLDGTDFLEAVLSFSQVEEFVIGFLRTRGLIECLHDVSSLEIEGRTASVIRTPRLRGSFPTLDLLETTGTRNVSLERFIQERGINSSDFRVQPEVLLKAGDALARMPLYSRTGGTHCSILFSQDGDHLIAAEDIGRHNAVDKAIGGGLIKGVDFATCWLAVSGRLPADMVIKPLLVGIPLIASVSAPTSEGVELGDRAGLTVVGFVRGGRLNCYCHPGRIE
jgi:FdhD protein